MKLRSYFKFILPTLIIAYYLLSCNTNNKKHFVIEGVVSNADTSMIYLEKRTLNNFVIIDSLKLSQKGDFKFKEISPEYPEFYVLKLNDQIINLAVDSTETINIKTSKENFGTNYDLKGSISSVKIKNVVEAYDKLYVKYKDLNKLYEQDELSSKEYANEVQIATREYKNLVSNLILVDKNSMAAYFALFQQIDNYMIFDITDKKDILIFQAVSTNWDQYKPDSPRTKHLKDFTLAALANMRKARENEKLIDSLAQKIEVPNSEFYDITLNDMHGNTVNLSSLKGKVVILDFSMYSSEYSPLHNIDLNKAYNKYKGAINIYQVSFDGDDHIWKNSANNLPWICVRSNSNNSAELIQKFNISDLPTTYVIDKNGLPIKRVHSSQDLISTIEKNL